MKEEVDYEKINTDFSVFDYLTEDQRNQLIKEKIERYKLQSDLNYSSWANIKAHEY